MLSYSGSTWTAWVSCGRRQPKRGARVMIRAICCDFTSMDTCTRSAQRRLEGECQRNIEVMWLLGRLVPDHKSIAEFRRLHGDAVTSTGAELIRFARSVGLVRGEWVVIDGSKFRAVSSIQKVHERKMLEKYLQQME